MYESPPAAEPPSCFEVPDSAFADPRLLSACPHDAHALEFNPFLVKMGKRQL